MSEHADKIITNGKLVSFDSDNVGASALAINGDKISAVGSDDDIANLKGPDTQVIDAEGATVMPGIVESHVHLFMGSTEIGALDVAGIYDKQGFADATRAYAAEHPELDILFGFGTNYFALDGPVTRQGLDEVISDRPLAVMASDHHTVFANTKALEMAGILHGGECDEGSEIAMADDGTATGALYEPGAFKHVIALTPTGGREGAGFTYGDDPVPAPSAAERAIDREILKKGLAHCASHGITTLHNMDGNFYQLELLQEIDDAGELVCRTQVPFHLKNFHPLEKLQDAVDMRERFNSDMVWSNRVKMFMDGVSESYTAYMLQEYPDKATCSEALFSVEHFNEACIKADEAGLQISVHAIGDAAIRQTLDGYEEARRVNGPRDSRHRIEHLEIPHRDDLPRLRELGVIASMQPLHSPAAGFFPPPDEGTIWHDFQKELAFPWKACREEGIVVAFSTDWPVVPVDVMPSMKGAVAAKDLGAPWPKQPQDLTDTIASYTRDGAYTEFTENRKGQLKTGMYADIAIMSHDLYALAPDDLDTARALYTICGGRITYQA